MAKSISLSLISSSCSQGTVKDNFLYPNVFCLQGLQFGYGKYVYPKEQMAEIQKLFSSALQEIFPGSKQEYLV